MKFPFFRAAKTEPAKVATLPARPITALRLRDTQRIDLDAEPTAPLAHAPNRPAAANGDTVAISARSLIAQLPTRLFAPGGQKQLETLQIHVPTAWVLPQLTSGRCEIRLGDLLPLLPAATLHQPPPVISEQQLVSLPLHEVIANLPPDLLQTKPDQVINIETPEFNNLPALFDDQFIARAEAATAAEVTTETAPVAVAPPPPAVATETDGQHVFVTLRSLVAVLPEVVFGCSRADLPRRADLEMRVPLPVEPMISQLNTGRVRLPVETVLRVLPTQVLANPLPDLRDETVPLPLGEIIPQLPPQLFQESPTSQPQEVIRFDDEIPMPFEEKPAPIVESLIPSEPVAPTAAVAEPPPEAPLAAAPVAEPPAPVVEEPAEDISTTIFAECPAPAVPVAPPAPKPAAPAKAPAEEIPAAIFAERSEPVIPVAPAAPVTPAAPSVASSTSETAPEPAETETISVTSETGEPAAVFNEHKCLVNLNHCTVDDLLTIEGIGPALARRIVAHRDAHGQFNSVEDLRQIPGIGRKTFRALVGSEPRSLNQLLGAPVDRELTLQEVVRYTAQLPGVTGCVVALNNGLFITGQLPPAFDQNAMSVFAPQLFRKIGRYTKELKVGTVKRMTIFTDEQPLSIFQAGEVYLVIVHDTRRFSKALLRRLERISRGLAALCRHRAVV